MHNVKRRYPSRSMQVRIMYIMLNYIHKSITSLFNHAPIEISLLSILRYLPYIALSLSYTRFVGDFPSIFLI